MLFRSEVNDFAKSNNQTYKTLFLNRILKFGRDENLISLKPLKVRAEIKIDTQIQPFSLEEIKLILQNAQGELKNFLSVGFFTGMRTGEILALRFENIDFANNKIYVCQSMEQNGNITSTKTHSARYIDMLEPAREALINQSKGKNKFVFELSLKKLRKQYYDLLESCNLARRTLYQTRHSFATLMLSNNEEPLWVSAMLGHKSLHTTFTHYVKYIPQTKKRASFLDSAMLGGAQ